MTQLTPATDLEQLLDVFEPTAQVDVDSDFYVKRDEDGLKKLARKLKRNRVFHGFLCGHVGSGKTTELIRLSQNSEIKKQYFPLLLRVGDLKIDSVNLTHDALLVGIALELLEKTNKDELDRTYQEHIDNWGKSIVQSFIKDESILAEAGAKAGAWLAFFKVMLKSRNQWKTEEKMRLEPKVQDLIMLLNQMAQDIFNNTGKRLLVMVDDLEKGTSESEKQMHHRLFSEYYSVLTAPRFNIIYTLPVYYRGLPDSRIEKDCIFAFSAVRIYEPEQKKADKPALNKQGEGFKLIEEFISQRIDKSAQLFEAGVLDELILIGGGLFRETDTAIAQAAEYALDREAQTVTIDDVKKVFNSLKKDYQPALRGNAVEVMAKVLETKTGWVDDVEPLLQSRAIVEYENGDLWLDVRYVLKAYLKSLLPDEPSKLVTP